MRARKAVPAAPVANKGGFFGLLGLLRLDGAAWRQKSALAGVRLAALPLAALLLAGCTPASIFLSMDAAALPTAAVVSPRSAIILPVNGAVLPASRAALPANGSAFSNVGKAASVMEKTAPMVEKAAPVTDTDVLSGQIFSYQMLLDGMALSLPCPVALLEAAGWHTEVPASEPFDAGLYGEVVYQKDEAQITATIANTTDTKTTLANCQVVGLSATRADGCALELPGGVTFGAARQQVLAVCGAPDRDLRTSGLANFAPVPGVYAPEAPPSGEAAPAAEDAPDGAAPGAGDAGAQNAPLCYTTGRYAYLAFTFDESGQLDGVTARNFWPLPTPPEPDTLPAEAAAYTPPQALGDNWQTYNIAYAGNLYTLPAPVSAFLQNGWILRDGDGPTVGGGQWLLGVCLQRGNQVLRTRVQNFSETPTALAGCFVTLVESSQVGADVPLALPGGVGSTSTLEEIVAAYGPPHGVYQSATALNYLYYGPNGRISCNFWVGSSVLYALEVTHTQLGAG